MNDAKGNGVHQLEKERIEIFVQAAVELAERTLKNTESVRAGEITLSGEAIATLAAALVQAAGITRQEFVRAFVEHRLKSS